MLFVVCGPGRAAARARDLVRDADHRALLGTAQTVLSAEARPAGRDGPLRLDLIALYKARRGGWDAPR